MPDALPPEKEKPKLKSKKSRPTKSLPTDRLTLVKQLDILRAYAVASGPAAKAVTNDDVGDIVKIHPGTVSLNNSFFYELGFLQRGDKGYIPAPEVFEFNRAYEWNPEIAPHKLAPIIARSWFGESLMPKLSFRSMTEDDAVANLAEAASAGPEYKSQLRLLLDYMQVAGLIVRDGNQVKLLKTGSLPIEKPLEEVTSEVKERQQKITMPSIVASPTEGSVQFHVSVKVDMKEFAGWEADRITAFFSGIAQVLAAKKAIEKDGD